MKCRLTARDLVEMARGAALDDAQAAALDRHLSECAECAARLDWQRALSADMKRLAEDTTVPALLPEREAAMLAAFDAAWERPLVSGRRRTIAAAGFITLAAALVWAISARRMSQTSPSAQTTASIVGLRPASAPVNRHAAAPMDRQATTPVGPPSAARSRRRTPPNRAPDPAPFVVLPGAADLPTFESGHLLRMQMPASVAVSIGLSPSSTSAVVHADVLVGQDGYARAVRLVP